MNVSRRDAKSLLREEIYSRLKAMTPSTRSIASKALCERFRQSHVGTKAQAILFFAPLNDEPDIRPLITEALREGRLVALPRYDAEEEVYAACQICNLEKDLLPGAFKIREPQPWCPVVPLNRLDLTLVPGVAFDLHGRRLGRGKGFYDQLLVGVRGTTCGVAFDEQIVADIPMEPHDIPLNCILTPSRWIEP